MFLISHTEQVLDNFMFKISSSQMADVLASMKLSVAKQNEVFEALELNPYDNYEDSDPDFNVVIYHSDLQSSIEEASSYPEDYDYFSEARNEEIENGSPLTAEEIQTVKDAVIEATMADECCETATVAIITDGENSVYMLYFEQIWGQGGLHFNRFFGFYETEAIAEEKMKTLEGVMIV